MKRILGLFVVVGCGVFEHELPEAKGPSVVLLDARSDGKAFVFLSNGQVGVIDKGGVFTPFEDAGIRWAFALRAAWGDTGFVIASTFESVPGYLEALVYSPEGRLIKRIPLQTGVPPTDFLVSNRPPQRFLTLNVDREMFFIYDTAGRLMAKWGPFTRWDEPLSVGRVAIAPPYLAFFPRLAKGKIVVQGNENPYKTGYALLFPFLEGGKRLGEPVRVDLAPLASAKAGFVRVECVRGRNGKFLILVSSVVDGGTKLELWELEPESRELKKLRDLGTMRGSVRASLNVLKGVKVVILKGYLELEALTL